MDRAASRGFRSAAFAILLIVWASDAAAQTTTAPPASTQWEISASLYNYFLPAERDYLQPTITADRGWFHLEGRANYEGRGVGSAWLGWNLSWGTHVVLDVTPMIGGVFGDTHGVAPGCKSALSWRALELASESEYVFDAGGRDSWFYYNWSQLTLSPVAWFHFGLVTQRTHVYATARDIQRGLLVGFSLPHLEITAHVFNPDDPDPTYVLSARVNFSLPKR